MSALTSLARAPIAPASKACLVKFFLLPTDNLEFGVVKIDNQGAIVDKNAMHMFTCCSGQTSLRWPPADKAVTTNRTVNIRSAHKVERL